MRVSKHVQYQQHARRLRRAWWDVALYGIPTASAAILLAQYFFEIRVQFHEEGARHATVYWTLATAGMIVGIAAAKSVGDYILNPPALAQKALANAQSSDASCIELAEEQIRIGMFIQLGVLDFPAVVLLFHSLLFGSAVSAILALVYCHVAFMALQPDAETLLEDTVSSMEYMVTERAT